MSFGGGILRKAERNGYLFAVFCIIVASLIFLPLRADFAKGQWALIYLLIVGLVAGLCGYGPALLAAVLAFFAWNFFLLPPFYTLRVADPKDWLSLIVFLIVAVASGLQTARMRQREAEALAREREAALLNRLSGQLVSKTTVQAMITTLLDEILQITRASDATLFAPNGPEKLQIMCVSGGHCPGPGSEEMRLAQWAFEQAKAIGLPAVQDISETAIGGWPVTVEHGTIAQSRSHNDIYLPLQTTTRMEGVLHIGARDDGTAYSVSDARLLVSIANMAAAFLERSTLEGLAAQAEALRESDRLKSTLMSSVSHELKTPLASVTATISGLLEGDVAWDEERVRTELEAISTDLDRLNDSIGDLLDLSRLEANAWRPRKEWYELGEVLGTVLSKIPAKRRGRILFSLPDDLPPAFVDFQQWARALQNLIENALIYGGPDTPVRVGAEWTHGVIRVWVEDEGPGIAPEERERIFEKFHRGRAAEKAPSGTGLGLAVTREIIRAHGGAIHIEDVRPHGARFVIELPAGETP